MLIRLAQRSSNARVMAAICVAVLFVMEVSACGDQASGQGTATDPQLAAIQRHHPGWDCAWGTDGVACTQPNSDSFAAPYEIQIDPSNGRVFFARSDGTILRASDFLWSAEDSVMTQYARARGSHPHHPNRAWPVKVKCQVVDRSLPYRFRCAVTKRGMTTGHEPVIVDLYGEIELPFGPGGY